MIHHFKACILTHSLDLADDFVYKALFQQFLRQVGVQNDCHVVICLRYITGLLSHIDQQVFFGQLHFCAVHVKFQCSNAFQLIHCSISIQLIQMLFDAAKLFAVFGSNCTQLRLEGVCSKVTHVICEDYLLDI